MKAKLGKVYLKVLIESCQITFKNWKIIFVHLLILLAVALLSPIGSFLGSMAGGFFMGILLSFALSAFLGTVQSAVNNEKMKFDEVWPRTLELISPVIGVLFILFLLSIISQVLIPKNAEWVVVSLQLLICVLFNPLFEVVYLEEASSTELFYISFDFMKARFLEWMFPYLVVLAPLFLWKPEFVENVALMMFTTNPIYMVSDFLALVGNLRVLFFVLPALPVILLCVYFLFIFRGKLYMQLIRG